MSWKWNGFHIHSFSHFNAGKQIRKASLRFYKCTTEFTTIPGKIVLPEVTKKSNNVGNDLRLLFSSRFEHKSSFIVSSTLSWTLKTCTDFLCELQFISFRKVKISVKCVILTTMRNHWNIISSGHLESNKNSLTSSRGAKMRFITFHRDSHLIFMCKCNCLCWLKTSLHRILESIEFNRRAII